MDKRIDPTNFSLLVTQLGDPVRARLAFRHLIAGGSAALESVRKGLRDSNPETRLYSVRVLDHIVDEDAWPEVIQMLSDPDPRVRAHALHAVACDRCKGDVCMPAKADILPRAIDILLHDPFHLVRAMAVEVVARFVFDDSEAAAALSTARGEDAAPGVRKKAGWFAPGGVIYQKKLKERSTSRRSKKSRPNHRVASPSPLH